MFGKDIILYKKNRNYSNEVIYYSHHTKETEVRN